MLGDTYAGFTLYHGFYYKNRESSKSRSTHQLPWLPRAAPKRTSKILFRKMKKFHLRHVSAFHQRPLIFGILTIRNSFPHLSYSRKFFPHTKCNVVKKSPLTISKKMPYNTIITRVWVVHTIMAAQARKEMPTGARSLH